MFQDRGRYVNIMSSTRTRQIPEGLPLHLDESLAGSRDTRTPSLVSFVGQTGAGKSTLIKLLIGLKDPKESVKVQSPVVGRPGIDVPTSEDVHLYSDPPTAYSQTPLLYADCEGLEGGEREPLGLSLRSHHQKLGLTPS